MFSLDRGWLTGRGRGVTKHVIVNDGVCVKGTTEHHLSVVGNSIPAEASFFKLHTGVQLLEDCSPARVDLRILRGLQTAEVCSIDERGLGDILTTSVACLLKKWRYRGTPRCTACVT